MSIITLSTSNHLRQNYTHPVFGMLKSSHSLFCFFCLRETISYSSLSISPSPSSSSSHIPQGNVCSMPVNGQYTTTCG